MHAIALRPRLPEQHRPRPVLVAFAPPATEPVPQACFDDLYRAHAGFVRRSLEKLGVVAASVDDATQDVFVVVLRHIHRFRPGSSERSWLFAIAVRVASDYRRSRSRRAAMPLEETLVASRGRTPLEHAMFEEAKTQLAALLDELPEAQREVYLLTELEELTAPEISARLGVNLSTVYTRLLTARKRVAEGVAQLAR